MLVSIITINYNNKNGLKKTIESVIEQSSSDYEFIVIDGGSSDGSVDVINQFSKNIYFWSSEPDRGVYHAMNKGVSHAHGKYCIFMNSGDVFFSSYVIEHVFAKPRNADFVCGNWCKNGKICQSPKKISAFFLFEHAICHQAIFTKMELLKDQPYDESLKLVSDWKHMFYNVVILNASYEHIDETICCYDMTGMSTVNWRLLAQERDETEIKLLPHRIYQDYKMEELSKVQMNNNPKLTYLISSVKTDSIEERFILKSLALLKCFRKMKRIFIR